MINPFVKIRDWFQDLPDKKKYIELVTATLSVPVLLSVVFMNYLNIQEKRTPTDTTQGQKNSEPTIITIIQEPEDEGPTPTPRLTGTDEPTPTPGRQEECIREIGPIEIRSPEENDTVTTNPFEIDVEYEQGDYCSVVWSYRIDGGSWSDYGDDDIVIYNLSSGKKTIELRVRSLASNDSTTLRRIFTYDNGKEIITPTDTPSPSP